MQINGGVFGSTGNIMFEIADAAKEAGIDIKCFSPITTTNRNRNTKLTYEKIGNYRLRQLNVMFSRITGYNGCFAYFETIKMLKSISKFQPNIIHFHNLHDSYINLPVLFHYIKNHNIHVIWTLHDCWAFTGKCPHFTMVKCNKWKTGCYNCPQIRAYPMSFVDRTKSMWKLKRKWFTGIQHMTIVSPSQWLADLVKESYLKEYPVKVINNGIDVNVFKPTTSDFRQQYRIEGKYILLGVANGWGRRKGLDVFIELSKRLDYNKYQIVVVGTNDEVDKQLPKNIISIHRTKNQQELAQIYTAADLFVNPTREENYPTVNMESIACGTPVLTFRTGGSPEMLDETCGSVVECDDIDALITKIEQIDKLSPCKKSTYEVKAQKFSKYKMISAYLCLYKAILSK